MRWRGMVRGRPPVIFIVMDTVRRDRVGCYGYDRPTTPNLDAFAGEATVYEDAIAQGTWSVPSHASMVTGQYPSQHRATKLRPFLRKNTVFSELSAAGYDTVGVSENGYVRPFTGFDGFDTFHAQRRLPFPSALHGPLQIAGNRMYAKRTVRPYIEQFYSWVIARTQARSTPMEKADEDLWTAHRVSEVVANDETSQPLCLFANVMDAHFPHSPLAGCRDELVDSAFHNMEIPHHHRPFMYSGEETTAEERQALNQYYDADVRTSDEQLGRIIAALKGAGIYDDALIIVVSDHGEHLGEHGRFGHCHSMHDTVVSVPLLIKYPGQTDGRRVSAQVETRRLYHTIRDTAGLADHHDMTLQGETEDRPASGEFYPPMLDVDYLHEHQQARYNTRFQGSRLTFVRHDGRKLVTSPDRTRLYDLSASEETALDATAHRETIESLSRQSPAAADTPF